MVSGLGKKKMRKKNGPRLMNASLQKRQARVHQTTTKKKMWINTMQCRDMLLIAMSYLDALSLSRLACVDKSTYGAAKTNRLWDELLHQRFPQPFHTWHAAIRTRTTARSIYKIEWCALTESLQQKRLLASSLRKNWTSNCVVPGICKVVCILSLFVALVNGFLESRRPPGALTMYSLWPVWLPVVYAAIELSSAPYGTHQSLWLACDIAMSWMAVLRGIEFVTCTWWVALGIPWFVAGLSVARFNYLSIRTNTINLVAFTADALVVASVAVLILKADGIITPETFLFSSWALAFMPLVCCWYGVATVFGAIIINQGGHNSSDTMALISVWVALLSTATVVAMIQSVPTHMVVFCWLVTYVPLFIYGAVSCVLSMSDSFPRSTPLSLDRTRVVCFDCVS